jgi:hypothetical protein
MLLLSEKIDTNKRQLGRIRHGETWEIAFFVNGS